MRRPTSLSRVNKIPALKRVFWIPGRSSPTVVDPTGIEPASADVKPAEVTVTPTGPTNPGEKIKDPIIT